MFVVCREGEAREQGGWVTYNADVQIPPGTVDCCTGILQGGLGCDFQNIINSVILIFKKKRPGSVISVASALWLGWVAKTSVL